MILKSVLNEIEEETVLQSLLNLKYIKMKQFLEIFYDTSQVYMKQINYLKILLCNPEQNVWQKVRKWDKIGEEQKILISPFV